MTLLLALFLSMALFFQTVQKQLLFERHFGAAWLDYRRRVPRLVPFAPHGG